MYQEFYNQFVEYEGDGCVSVPHLMREKQDNFSPQSVIRFKYVITMPLHILSLEERAQVTNASGNVRFQ